MEKVKYREIAEMIGKSEGTIKGWRVHFPELLEIVKLGALCKKNGITPELLKQCLEIKKIAGGS